MMRSQVRLALAADRHSGVVWRASIDAGLGVGRGLVVLGLTSSSDDSSELTISRFDKLEDLAETPVKLLFVTPFKPPA